MDFLFGQNAHMRWIAHFFHAVVGGPLFGRQHEIRDGNASSGPANADHFGKYFRGIREMMEAITSQDHVEKIRREGQLSDVADLPEQVSQTKFRLSDVGALN